ncbi:MAG: hypothetical protein WCE63_13280 [Acidobacteriaceae bacterium]
MSEADHNKLKDALHAMAAMLVQSRNTEKTSTVLEKPQGPAAGAVTQPEGQTPRHPDTAAMEPKLFVAHTRWRSRTKR